MKILVINAGSSSLKFQVIDMDNESVIAKGICEEIGGITVIDGFNFVPQETELYADLRLHPTNEGFDFYAKNLICEIKKHI